MHLKISNVCPRQTRDRVCAENTWNGLLGICRAIDGKIILSSGWVSWAAGLSSKDPSLDWQYV